MIGRRLIFFDKPLQRSNLCASHRQRRWLTHGELIYTPLAGDGLYVSERDLSEWCDAAVAFWEELSVDD